jgi:isopentenyl-diphosphate delta-isomerase
VIVKEVGWGMSRKTVRRLLDAGVSAIDVSGAGGTSWSQVEMHRIKDPYRAKTAAAFINWGIPTAKSILNVRAENKNLPVFASGGLKSGIDIVKSLALGANLGGMAGLFLKAANTSAETAVQTMQMIVDQVKIAMFSAGAAKLSDLNPSLLSKQK